MAAASSAHDTAVAAGGAPVSSRATRASGRASSTTRRAVLRTTAEMPAAGLADTVGTPSDMGDPANANPSGSDEGGVATQRRTRYMYVDAVVPPWARDLVAASVTSDVGPILPSVTAVLDAMDSWRSSRRAGSGGPVAPAPPSSTRLRIEYTYEDTGLDSAWAAPASAGGLDANRDGVPPSVMRQLHRFFLSTGDLADGVARCAICFDSLGGAKELLRLPCWCAFHREEIELWLSNHATCPVHVTRTVEEYLNDNERFSCSQ